MEVPVPIGQPQAPPAPCWSNIVQKPPAPKPASQPINLLFGDCKSTKGIAVAVVDANAIIQGGDDLRHRADKLVSTKEVIEEVRDPASRRNLMLMLSTIETMEPSPESLKTVVDFARETGDLQTLSDVDLKLIALTYSLEAQLHGTKHLRDRPPPVHTVKVKKLAENDMPGWGSNVPNLEEWEALEHAVEVDRSMNSQSRILPLKDMDLNVVSYEDNVASEDCGEADAPFEAQGGRRKRYMPAKKEINLERKMVLEGSDVSHGEADDNGGEWAPAVSRSTRRRFLRRKARRELSEMSTEKDDQSVEGNMEVNDDENDCHETICEGSEVTPVEDGDLSSILKDMRLVEKWSSDQQEGKEIVMISEELEGNENISVEGDATEMCDGDDHLENSSQTTESIDLSLMDDTSTEKSWMLRSLSESSVACVTGDFAMQNVILQIGLRLLAPGGMQIRQLHRWILKCHACNKVTAEIGRIFCPKCGNGGTLRKVAVTVGENGVVLAASRPRITLRGTKFSLPLPQGGRDAIIKNLILREDQLPHKVLYPKTKKKGNKQGEDAFTSDYIFGPTADKRAPLRPPIRKALAVFSGKRNPNDNHYSRSKH